MKHTEDIFNKRITITDLDQAILQTNNYVEYSKTTEIIFSEVIANKEIQVSGLEYWTNLNTKLKTIKENEK